jgi:hypothetical protein
MCLRLALLITANVVPSALILFTLIMEATSSSESTVLITATRRHIPEDSILHSHRVKPQILQYYIQINEGREKVILAN